MGQDLRGGGKIRLAKRRLYSGVVGGSALGGSTYLIGRLLKKEGKAWGRPAAGSKGKCGDTSGVCDTVGGAALAAVTKQGLPAQQLRQQAQQAQQRSWPRWEASSSGSAGGRSNKGNTFVEHANNTQQQPKV